MAHPQLYAAEGVGGRLKTKGGQLVPLKQRMPPSQQAKRMQRIAARRTIAEQLAREQGMIRLVLQNFFTRGIWGRMTWFLTGK